MRPTMVNTLSNHIEKLAARLVACYAERTLLTPLNATRSDFDIDAAYRVLDEISTLRRRAGWQPVGRKIGFPIGQYGRDTACRTPSGHRCGHPRYASRAMIAKEWNLRRSYNRELNQKSCSS